MADPTSQGAPGSVAAQAQSEGVVDAVSDVLGVVNNVTGFVANVFSAVQVGVQALQLLGVLGTPANPDAQYFQEIDTRLDALSSKLNTVLSTLENEILGVDHELVRAECYSALSDARAALHAAVLFAGNPQDAEQLAGLTSAIAMSEDAVQKLGPYGLWTRVNSPEGFYYDLGNGTLEPADADLGSNLVFDYRYALPAYMEAVSDRLLVLCAADASYAAARRNETKRYADVLAGIHNKILGAFRVLPLPNAAKFAETAITMQPGLIDRSGEDWRENNPGNPWLESGAVFGVVETYSGATNLQKYPLHLLAGLTWAHGTAVYDATGVAGRIQYHLQVASVGLAVAFYRSSGLAHVWEVVVRFYGMIGLAPPAIAANLLPYTAQSLRVAAGLAPAGTAASLRALGESMSDVRVTVPPTNAPATVQPVAGPTSLNGLFTFVAGPNPLAATQYAGL